AARCSRHGAIPGYIDNLMRLSLIDAPQRLKIDDERLYRDLLAQSFVTEHCARIPSVLQPRIERAVLTLTDFGSQFRRCCIEAAEPAPRMTRP
ncbi:MAG: Abi-alpha family protein, partial [Hyphomonas sp.]